MKRKNDYQIYLVFLEQDTVRRVELMQRFTEYYKVFNVLNAVDGRKLTAKEYYDKTINYFLSCGRVMSPAELGCTLSHIKALESFLATSAPYALILEDDVIGCDADIDKIFKFAAKLDENSLLLCGAQDGLATKKYQLGKKTSTESMFEVLPFSYKYIFRTCCYIVTQKSAKAILEYHKSSLTLADKWDEFFKNTPIKIYYSDIMHHPVDLINSHIEAERVLLYKKKTFLKKLFSEKILSRLCSKAFKETRRISYATFGFKKL